MSQLDQGTQEKHEEEVLALKKQLRSQEGEWKKNKAVLEQRIEILELQNRELKEKEENLKKMNNSIFTAMSDFNKESDPKSGKIVRDLEASKQHINKEYNDYKIKSQEIIKNFEKENFDLKQKIVEVDKKYNQANIHFGKHESMFQQKINSLENENKNIASLLRQYEEENKQLKEREINQNELQTKLSEVRYLLERQNNEHRREAEKANHEYTQSINNMKSQAESQRVSLEVQIRKLIESKKIDQTSFDDLKNNYETEISILRRERDNTFKRNDALENQANKFNEIMKHYEERLAQQREDQEKDTKEYKKLRLRIAELESQIKKYEQSENNLKQMVTEREYKMEEIIADYKKKVNNEKRRYDQANDLAKKYKEEGEKKYAMAVQESMKKDELIKKLKGQPRGKDEKLSRKMEEGHNRANTSLVNISLMGHSSSGNSKYNSNRSFVQEVTPRDASRSMVLSRKNQNRLSRDIIFKPGKETIGETVDTMEDEQELRDTTNENILTDLNSPRIFTTANSFRNHASSKKEGEVSVTPINANVQKMNRNFKKNEKLKLNISLCEPRAQDIGIQEKITEEENHSTQRGKTQAHKLTRGPQNLSTTAIETKHRKFRNSDFSQHYQSEKTFHKVHELGKASPFDIDSSQSFIHITDVSTHHHLANSVSHHPLSSDPSDANLSRGFQEMLDANRKSNMFGYRQKNYDNFDSGDEKVKELQERLRESEMSNEKTRKEKEKLEGEFERLVSDLKKTKMEWALSEESKEECELALKNEIKFLINKLLQVKNPSANMSSSHSDFSQFTKSTLNKSSIDHPSSVASNTDFLNLSHYNPSHNYASSNSNYAEHNSMISDNVLRERKLNEFPDRRVRKSQKAFFDQTDVPLRNRCLNSSNLEIQNESPRKTTEFNKNENNLLMNLLSTNTGPKKLMRNIKQ